MRKFCSKIFFIGAMHIVQLKKQLRFTSQTSYFKYYRKLWVFCLVASTINNHTIFVLVHSFKNIKLWNLFCFELIKFDMVNNYIKTKTCSYIFFKYCYKYHNVIYYYYVLFVNDRPSRQSSFYGRGLISFQFIHTLYGDVIVTYKLRYCF